MSKLLDEISRIIASPLSRREAFRLVSRAVGGAALGSLGLGRVARALGPPAPAQVGCPSGKTACGPICCGSDQTCCLNKDGTTATCCSSGQTCCGGRCCKGKKCCSGTCCPLGPMTRRALIGGAVAGAVTATVLGTRGGGATAVTNPPAPAPSCPAGTTRCGTKTPVVCCASGQTCCGSGTTAVCCAKNVVCCNSKCCSSPGRVCCNNKCCDAGPSASLPCTGATKCV